MERNRAIDILRFLGPLLITNSHMDLIYPNPLYATGGALGDAIFFFISGFTLNFTKHTTVFEWFKRRLYRIYLVVFSVVLFHEIFSLNDRTLIDTLLNGGGWFIKCLLIYPDLLRHLASRTMLSKNPFAMRQIHIGCCLRTSPQSKQAKLAQN